MFLPTTKQEIHRLGWDRPDIILVTGDTYIDSPYIGIAVIGKILAQNGFRVAVIAQPDTKSPNDITRLGAPLLFWGVSAGSVDSMVANYTALKKRRKTDDYTPGGVNNRRPDRACIVYTNLIRQYAKPAKPVVLGGIEASLRRIAHYDFWSDRIRRSILLDAKADFLIFGMARQSIVELARALQNGTSPRGIRGLAYMSKKPVHHEVPSFESVTADQSQFIESFERFYRNNDPATAEGLCQKYADRYLVLNPPEPHPSQEELDAVFDMDFERAVHPYYQKMGPVRAMDTIRFSIPTHIGCYGECHFCAIAVHQGRTVRWRSETSILREAERLTALDGFTGIIRDIGGPTANMYGFECRKKLTHGPCPDRRCLFPDVCPSLKPDHSRLTALLENLSAVRGIRKVFIGSGIRHDLVLADRANGMNYLKTLIRNHVSGQMKIAPEHVSAPVLALMGKPPADSLLEFKRHFDVLSSEARKKQFLTYYLIAAHPGCTLSDMKQLKHFARRDLKINPEQVQIFTPTPSTYSTLMYATGMNPFTGKKIFVEKNRYEKQKQKEIIIDKKRKKS